MNNDTLQSQLKHYITTMIKIPEQAHQAVIDIKKAILLEMASQQEDRKEQAWILFSLVDRMLFFTTTKSTSEKEEDKTALSIVMDRIHRFWQGQWMQLLNEAKIEAHVSNNRDQKKAVSDIAKEAQVINDLIKDNEQVKAMQRVKQSAPLITGPEAVPMLKAALADPKDHQQTVRTPEPSHNIRNMIQELRKAVKENLVKSLKKTKRRVAPGPLGARAEHMAFAKSDPEFVELLAENLTDLTMGNTTKNIRDAHRVARMLALRKSPTKARPLACGSLFRRLCMQAVARAKKRSHTKGKRHDTVWSICQSRNRGIV